MSPCGPLAPSRPEPAATPLAHGTPAAVWRLLVATGDEHDGERVRHAVGQAGHAAAVHYVASLAEALEVAGRTALDALLLDPEPPAFRGLPGGDVQATLDAWTRTVPDVPVMVVLRDPDAALTRRALGAGAQDVLVHGECLNDDGVVLTPPHGVIALRGSLERAAGYEVIGAMDSIMATHLAMTKQPDVIILDIGLPGDDGHVLSHRWSTHVNTRHVPVIYVTARTAAEDVSRAERTGVFAYLTKPYEPADLLALVRQAAEQGRRHAPMVVRGVPGYERFSGAMPVPARAATARPWQWEERL